MCGVAAGASGTGRGQTDGGCWRQPSGRRSCGAPPSHASCLHARGAACAHLPSALAHIPAPAQRQAAGAQGGHGGRGGGAAAGADGREQRGGVRPAAAAAGNPWGTGCTCGRQGKCARQKRKSGRSPHSHPRSWARAQGRGPGESAGRARLYRGRPPGAHAGTACEARAGASARPKRGSRMGGWAGRDCRTGRPRGRLVRQCAAAAQKKAEAGGAWGGRRAELAKEGAGGGRKRVSGQVLRACWCSIAAPAHRARTKRRAGRRAAESPPPKIGGGS
jgi:hypothetical protein